MPIISFSVFKDKILDGTKTQTIRRQRKHPKNCKHPETCKHEIKEGSQLYLWWKSRTPQREKLFETPCTQTLKIKLYIDENSIDACWITKQGDSIGYNYNSLISLARRDGFYTPEEMRKWFFEMYGCIAGEVFDVIRWNPPALNKEAF